MLLLVANSGGVAAAAAAAACHCGAKGEIFGWDGGSSSVSCHGGAKGDDAIACHVCQNHSQAWQCS